MLQKWCIYRFWLQVIILARFLRFSFAAGPETYPEYNNQYSLRFSQLAQNSLQSTSSNTAAGSETRFWLQVIILARFPRFSPLAQKPLQNTSINTTAGSEQVITLARFSRFLQPQAAKLDFARRLKRRSLGTYRAERR